MEELFCVTGLEIMTNKLDGLIMIRCRVHYCEGGDTTDTQMTAPLILAPGVAETMTIEISKALADLRQSGQQAKTTPPSGGYH